MAVKKLEDELGIILFERTASDIRVTPVGALVIAQAERVKAGLGGQPLYNSPQL